MAPHRIDCQDVTRMSRQELIHEILELNKGSTFRFTEGWLRRQRMDRLRSLLLDSRRQHRPREHGPSGPQSAV
jgi:hypothetical protein